MISMLGFLHGVMDFERFVMPLGSSPVTKMATVSAKSMSTLHFARTNLIHATSLTTPSRNWRIFSDIGFATARR